MVDKKEFFSVTRISRSDIKSMLGFEHHERIDSLSDEEMHRIAGKMGDAYQASGYWIDLKIMSLGCLEVRQTMSKFVGYSRKSRSGNTLSLSISADAFNEAERYKTKDGHEYVNLIINIDKILEVIDGTREVTSVCQIVE